MKKKVYVCYDYDVDYNEIIKIFVDEKKAIEWAAHLYSDNGFRRRYEEKEIEDLYER